MSDAPSSIHIHISHVYRDRKAVRALVAQLDPLLRSDGASAAASCWHAELVAAGDERETARAASLAKAQLCLLLLSVDYLASRERQREAAEIMALHPRVAVIPILLRPVVALATLPFGKLAPLPGDGRAVSVQASPEQALADIATELHQRVARLRGVPLPAASPPRAPRVVPERRRRRGPQATVQAQNIQHSTVIAATGAVTVMAAPSAPPEHPEDPALRAAYLKRVCQEAGHLPLEGIDRQAAGSHRDTHLQLQSVYTALLTRGALADPSVVHVIPAQREHRSTPALDRLSQEHRPASALERLDRHDRLVLLGDPGSGKSTFVNFVALCLARADLATLRAPLPSEEKPQPWRHGALLPVRVILRDLAAWGLPPVGERVSVEHLWRFLAATLGDFAAPLRRELQQRGGLLLFDGLDEVPEAEQRRDQVRGLIEDFARQTAHCRVLVTCRTYAYHREGFRLTGFAEVELLPFTEAQINLFVERFYDHCGALRGQSPTETKGRAALLQAAIANSQRLAELASRPLLLTLMTSLHGWRGGSLPERREELYEDTVKLLLDLWESPKVVKDEHGRPRVQHPSLAEFLRVGQEQVRKLLDELAYEAHASQPELRGTADIPRAQLLDRLMDLSQRPDPQDRLLIQYLQDRAGLLLPRGNRVFTFPHRTFQEYLAACHLCERGYPDTLADKVRADPERWREVALLAGARAARFGAAMLWPLVDALCPGEPGEGEAADAWGAQIAGQLLLESADLTSKVKGHVLKVARVKRWLRRLLRSGELPARERALAGANLGRLGDEREEIGLSGMLLCHVPAGPFWMGSDDADEDEKPAHVVNLPYGYWIGKNPVTNRQYGEFVAAGGYRERALWPEAERVGRWRPGEYKNFNDAWYREARSRGGPAHPVVGVSWYEALAFCRWLGQRLGAGWRCQLPSEAEWEKAARGGLQVPVAPLVVPVGHLVAGLAATLAKTENPLPRRTYPCGDEMTPEQANYDESGISDTSAVGCFPAGVSPLGCEEQSGNVWEWTRTLWATRYPYKADDGREALEADEDIGRVIRGGAFYQNISNARCASRLYDLPNYWYDYYGFRVVAAHTSGL